MQTNLNINDLLFDSYKCQVIIHFGCNGLNGFHSSAPLPHSTEDIYRVRKKHHLIFSLMSRTVMVVLSKRVALMVFIRQLPFLTAQKTYTGRVKKHHLTFPPFLKNNGLISKNVI